MLPSAMLQLKKVVVNFLVEAMKASIATMFYVCDYATTMLQITHT